MIVTLIRCSVCSAFYLGFRRAAIWVFGLFSKAKDLEPVIGFGDNILAKTNRFLGPLLFNFSPSPSLKTTLFDLEFASPVTFASFKDDHHLIEIWLRLGIGGGCLKTILPEPHTGNARPRLQEVCVDGQPGLINHLGLPGKGVIALSDSLADLSFLRFNRPIGLSIGGHCLADYQKVFDCLHHVVSSHSFCSFYYELNISCPNTPDGQNFIKNPDLLTTLLAYIRQKSNLVLSVKVSPDQSDDSLCQVAEICKGFDKVFINAGNTQYRNKGSVGLPEKALALPGGGLSGGALFERTLSMVRLLSGTGVPVMATGGISSVDHVRTVMGQGAALCGIATGLVFNPDDIVEINTAIAKYRGIDHLK